MGFPGGSAGNESTCSEGDWVRSLGWEDPLEKGTAIHSGIPAWNSVHGVAKSQTRLGDFHLDMLMSLGLPFVGGGSSGAAVTKDMQQCQPTSSSPESLTVNILK